MSALLKQLEQGVNAIGLRAIPAGVEVDLVELPGDVPELPDPRSRRIQRKPINTRMHDDANSSYDQAVALMRNPITMHVACQLGPSRAFDSRLSGGVGLAAEDRPPAVLSLDDGGFAAGDLAPIGPAGRPALAGGGLCFAV